MKKNPRFFCDNCGNEVGRDTKTCPHCGRFFAAVRCPSCGFSGEESTFAKGCPVCGYSSGESRPLAPAEDSDPAPQSFTPPAPKIPAKPLPLWVYIVSILAFAGACVLLYFRLAG